MNAGELSDLEAKGREAVLRDMALGRHGEAGSRMRNEVESWLRSSAEASNAVDSTRRNAREAETLSIANEAPSIAKEANRIASRDLSAAEASAASAREHARWARWAAIIATVAAIVATSTHINELIAFLQK